MKLWFIRHGDPDYDNDCLTALGRQEAKALADRLAEAKIRAFYLSPLGRARETAEATLSRRKEEGTVCDWLREFDAPIHRPDRNGELAITWDWLPQDWVPVDAFYSIDTWLDEPHMVETQVKKEYDRVCTGLDGILSGYGYERDGRFYTVREANTDTICFFCHYGVTCVLLSHLLSISPMLLWHGVVAAPASLTEVVTEERREGIATWRMSRYGDVAHLDAAGLGGNTNARFTEVYADLSQRHD